MNNRPARQRLADPPAVKLMPCDPGLAPASLVVLRSEGEISTLRAPVSGPCLTRALAASGLDQLKRPAPATRWRRRIPHLQARFAPVIQQESAP